MSLESDKIRIYKLIVMTAVPTKNKAKIEGWLSEIPTNIHTAYPGEISDALIHFFIKEYIS